MLTNEVLDVLRGVPPFAALPAAVQRLLARRAQLEYYPDGAVILDTTGGGQGCGFVHVIRKGAVRLGPEASGRVAGIGRTPAGFVADEAIEAATPVTVLDADAPRDD